MTRVDELPPDQRAALSLLLRRRKSYDELAAILGIPPRAVHDRAHAALAVLAPREARALSSEQRAQIADYLLGQQELAERLRTRTLLSDSDSARIWALRVAGELEPIADGALAEIPGRGAAAPAPAEGAAVPGPAGAGPDAHPGAATASVPRGGGAEPDDALQPTAGGLPVSRVGGAVLLAVLLAAVVVAVVLLTGGSSHSKAKGAAAASTTATGPKIDQRLVLRSPQANSPTVALVQILSEGGKRAFYIAAEHLPPSRGFFYVIWLYNSPNSFEPLSRAPTVGSNERLAGGSFLPSNAGEFHEMLVTREHSENPTRPGTIVLRGAFSLGS